MLLKAEFVSVLSRCFVEEIQFRFKRTRCTFLGQKEIKYPTIY